MKYILRSVMRHHTSFRGNQRPPSGLKKQRRWVISGGHRQGMPAISQRHAFPDYPGSGSMGRRDVSPPFPLFPLFLFLWKLNRPIATKSNHQLLYFILIMSIIVISTRNNSKQYSILPLLPFIRTRATKGKKSEKEKLLGEIIIIIII